MDETARATSRTETLKTITAVLMVTMIISLVFLLPAYWRWQIANEPVIGIGISYKEVVTKSTMVLDKVHENTPAFRAGLQKGDIIAEVNGKEMVTASDFQEVIKTLSPGSIVTLAVLRDGKKLVIATEVANLKRKNFK